MPERVTIVMIQLFAVNPVELQKSVCCLIVESSALPYREQESAGTFKGFFNGQKSKWLPLTTTVCGVFGTSQHTVHMLLHCWVHSDIVTQYIVYQVIGTSIDLWA